MTTASPSTRTCEFGVPGRHAAAVSAHDALLSFVSHFVLLPSATTKIFPGFSTRKAGTQTPPVPSTPPPCFSRCSGDSRVLCGTETRVSVYNIDGEFTPPDTCPTPTPEPFGFNFYGCSTDFKKNRVRERGGSRPVENGASASSR